MRRNSPRRHGPGDEPDWVDPDLDNFDEFFPEDSPAPRPRPIAGQPSAPPPAVGWRQRLSTLNQVLQAPPPDRPWPAGRQILYVIDVAATMEGLGLTLEVVSRRPKQDGSWSQVRPAKIRFSELGWLPDEVDRRILALLMGPKDSYGSYGGYYFSLRQHTPHRFRIPGVLQDTLVPMICATGRCVLRVRGRSPSSRPCGGRTDRPGSSGSTFGAPRAADYDVISEKSAARRGAPPPVGAGHAGGGRPRPHRGPRGAAGRRWRLSVDRPVARGG